MSVPFDAQRGLVIVRAELWGHSGSAVLQLALDTGATSTVVNVAMLVALGCDPALAAERIQITTGSGVEFAPRVHLRRIVALGLERSPYLEVTYRHGRPLAAYYYLPRRTGDRASRTSRGPSGLLIDFTRDGRAIGIEITAPSLLSLASMNRVLRQLGQKPVKRTDLSPLLAA